MAVISVSYADSTPPSPVADLYVANYETPKYVLERGYLDTGAYTTLIPNRLVSQLNLKLTGHTPLNTMHGANMSAT